MAFKLDHVHVKTRDPRATANFYIDALGGKLVDTSAGETRFRVDLPGVRLNISGIIETQSRAQHLGLEHLALETDDLDGAVARLQEKGARVLEQFVSPVPAHNGMRICFLEGLDGVQLELIEVKAL